MQKQVHPARLFAFGRSAQAARELFEGIYHPEASLGVFFCSTDYDLHALERELNARFAGMPLIGCTSAGEITPAGYSSAASSASPWPGPTSSRSRRRSHNLRNFSIADGHDHRPVAAPRTGPGVGRPSADNTFAFLLIDGLCKCEEVVLSAISSALGDIPLFGGSSGGRADLPAQLRFRQRPFPDGRRRSRAGPHAAAVQAVHHRPLRQFGHQDGGDRGRSGRPASSPRSTPSRPAASTPGWSAWTSTS